MTTQEELKIVECAKSDVHSFNQIYEYYFNRIYCFCINRLGSKESSEDITSHVFLEAVEQIHKFDTTKGIRFGSWLYKVAHNKIIDFYRKNRKSVIFDSDQFDNITSEDGNNLDGLINKGQIKKQVIIIVRELNPRYQEVISLRFFSELEIPEISSILNLNPARVSVLLHRALQTFKKKYLKKYPKSEIFELF